MLTCGDKVVNFEYICRGEARMDDTDAKLLGLLITSGILLHLWHVLLLAIEKVAQVDRASWVALLNKEVRRAKRRRKYGQTQR